METIENFNKYELISRLNKPIVMNLLFKSVSTEILIGYIFQYCKRDDMPKILNYVFSLSDLQTYIHNKNINIDILKELLIKNDIVDENKVEKLNRLRVCTRLNKNICFNLFLNYIDTEDIKNLMCENISDKKLKKLYDKLFINPKLKNLLMFTPLNEEDYEYLTEINDKLKNENFITIEEPEKTILDDNIINDDEDDEYDDDLDLDLDEDNNEIIENVKEKKENKIKKEKKKISKTKKTTSKDKKK